jgi:mannonate dehydratase
MRRRNFLLSTGPAAAALAGGLSVKAAKAAPAKRGLMVVGTETEVNDARMAGLARFGVKNICGRPIMTDQSRTYATVEELQHTREVAEKYGIRVECITPVLLPSSHIDKEPNPSIMLAQSPQRDRDIEAFQTQIKNCAAAGIPSVKYNMSILGVLRTGQTQGRGDAKYSTYKLADAHPNPPLTKAGVVNADQYWERITYFLERVVPVANEYKTRILCHPNDSPVPPAGYQGVNAVLGTVDGLKRFVSIHENPYHGLNFCQGTVSEMLRNPGEEIFDVIRYFGTRKKIFNLHFRNIRGHRDEFMEVFPDEGDIDFVRAIKVYQEVGYAGMILPDHVPVAAGDPGQYQSFAYCFGYIKALLQTIGEA